MTLKQLKQQQQQQQHHLPSSKVRKSEEFADSRVSISEREIEGENPRSFFLFGVGREGKREQGRGEGEISPPKGFS